jgi:hypothetical protein
MSIVLIKIQEELAKWQCCCYQEEVKIVPGKDKLKWCPAHQLGFAILPCVPSSASIILLAALLVIK